MESYAINLVLPKLQNGTKWNVTSLQLEILIFALILGLLRGMLGRSFLLELPPRARRILPAVTGITGSFGTTSACAENTDCGPYGGFHPGNYLRVRGEYGELPPGTLTSLELPPRARRIPGELFSQEANFGTTSACAENTCCQSERICQPRNYLRVRGEYMLSE